MAVACHVQITGRVQGVFYRAWSREQARELGVRGWIRNCSDGTVEAQLEGEADGVDELIRRLRVGPSGARVDLVEVKQVDAESFGSFEVRH